MRIAAIHLHVHSLERAHGFYAGCLGLPVKADGAATGWRVYALDDADLVVQAVAPDAPEDEQALVGRPTGLALGVDDIHARQHSLAVLGVPFAGPPERQPWGGWVSRFEDPDGNELQLVQRLP